MKKVLVNLFALFLSIGILLVGNGLQGTLIGVRAQIEGFSTSVTGFVMSAYFIGFILGALHIPKLVERAGHIRVFATFASIASASTLVHIVSADPYVWAVMRAITGASLAGLYMVTESWLNGQATNQNRGTIFSLYMMLNLGAVALGQQFLNFADPAGPALFLLTSILFSVAVAPVALTKSVAPPVPIPTERLSVRGLYRITPVGTFCTFGAGIANGAFWGMAPVFAYELGLSTAKIATFMSVVVIGGMLLQMPIGWLSDKLDRRTVIGAACLILTATSFAMIAAAGQSYALLLGLSFIFGGFLLTINSLCTAHTNDHIDRSNLVHASGALLLLFGVGAAVGPWLASLVMQAFGGVFLYAFIGGISGVLVAFVIMRMALREAPQVTGRFVPVPESTHHVMLLDPRLNAVGMARETDEFPGNDFY